jgi:hypothetical protein
MRHDSILVMKLNASGVVRTGMVKMPLCRQTAATSKLITAKVPPTQVQLPSCKFVK